MLDSASILALVAGSTAECEKNGARGVNKYENISPGAEKQL